MKINCASWARSFELAAAFWAAAVQPQPIGCSPKQPQQAAPQQASNKRRHLLVHTPQRPQHIVTFSSTAPPPPPPTLVFVPAPCSPLLVRLRRLRRAARPPASAALVADLRVVRFRVNPPPLLALDLGLTLRLRVRNLGLALRLRSSSTRSDVRNLRSSSPRPIAKHRTRYSSSVGGIATRQRADPRGFHMPLHERQPQPGVQISTQSSTSSYSPPECTRYELRLTTSRRNHLEMAVGRAEWDNNLIKVLLDLCIAKKEKLNYNNKKGLTNTGWKNLYRNFRDHTGKCYDRKQLQNKFNTLKRHYKVWTKLKAASGGGWDSTTHTIAMDDEWWADRITEDQVADTFRRRPLQYEDELNILFGSMDTEDGNMLCVGGIGHRTPSGGSEENHILVSDDNVGGSSVDRTVQRAGKEQVVDSPPAKSTKSMEYYVSRISENMLERSRNESSAMSREQDEVTELLRVVEEDGVDQGSKLYFIATELFRLPARRASFRSFHEAQHRIAWLKWT